VRHNNFLKVMLQGPDAQEIANLVKETGGEITHDLPIINAVGATLTRNQLDHIAQSPLITRHIDDLSLDHVPEGDSEQARKACEVRGGIELEINNPDIIWTLYNKRSTPAQLASLDLKWPEQWGVITSISLGGKPLDIQSLIPATANHAQLKIPPSRNSSIEQQAQLTIGFSNLDNSPAIQGDFTMEARFVGDCSTELVPGYADNHENFQYSTLVGADQLHAHGITGKKITVAIIDSGLWEHDLLANNTLGEARVLARYDAIQNVVTQEAFDESGHGSHMTSVLGHSGKILQNGVATGSFQGISPDVNLVAVKAFNIEGQGEMLDIVRAVQWVVANREKFNIRVLNLSFASRPRWNYWLDPVNQAVMHAWAAGITVVAAAGNEGPEPMSIGSPGNLPYVITVGAVTDSWTPHDRADDYIPDFSSQGPTPSAHIKPDLVAPGGHITGLTRPGSTLMREHPEYQLSSGQFVMTGSSQASALVAGIAALLLQLEPDLSPDDVKCKLISSAEPAINSDGLLAYSPFQQGHGYVSATRAITLGQRDCGNPNLDIKKDLDDIEHFEGPATVNAQGEVTLPGLEKMLSPLPNEKGLSQIRNWGVKAHIERNQEGTLIPPDANSPFDWELLYKQEKATIESLAK
jgi:hypothetical protein